MEDPTISGFDYFLLPVYCLLLTFIFIQIKKRYPHNILVQKYFIKGFIVKLLGGIFFAFLVYYYYGYGDTLSYFRDSLQLRDLLSNNKISFTQIFTEDYQYFHDRFDMLGSVTESGFLVTKIGFLLTYISFSRFIIATVLMASLCYFGMFRLFQAFVLIAPGRHRLISIFVLFFPTVVIYGSGLFKDPICISALGWLFYATYKMISEKKITLLNVAIVIISALFIIEIKIYILAAYIIPYFIFLIITLVKKIKSALFRAITFPLLILIVVLTYNTFADSIDDVMGSFAVEKLSDNIKGLQNSYDNMTADDAGSNFTIGDFEPTLSGVITKMPVGIVATLYRPFIWEVRKPIILLPALESLLMLLYTIFAFYKAGFLRFFKLLITDATVFLCIFYSLIFAGLVGLSTLNFGTLSRYRIPVIPFFLFGLMLIIQKAMEHKKLQKEHQDINAASL